MKLTIEQKTQLVELDKRRSELCDNMEEAVAYNGAYETLTNFVYIYNTGVLSYKTFVIVLVNCLLEEKSTGAIKLWQAALDIVLGDNKEDK